jgi:hypothetical protein
MVADDRAIPSGTSLAPRLQRRCDGLEPGLPASGRRGGGCCPDGVHARRDRLERLRALTVRLAPGSASRRFTTGLIAYGTAGLVAALLELAALAWVSGRVSTVVETVDAEARQLTTVLDRTADALHDAGSSAVSFAVTLERTPSSVRQAAATIRDLRPNLREIEAQLAAINILGTQPLANPARLFGDMASDLEGLDIRLELIAADIGTDRDTLLANARSLTEAGDETALLSDRVRSGFIQGRLDDLRGVLLITILVFVAWTTVPSVGALLLGIWLHRRLDNEAGAPKSARAL